MVIPDILEVEAHASPSTTKRKSSQAASACEESFGYLEMQTE
jgi:hypothetical protein